MPNTTNLNLVVTDDDSELFGKWRKDINGVDNSNMKKIDDFAGKFAGGAANQYYKKKSTSKFDGVWETPDTTPTEGSTKLITSNAVFAAIEKVAEDMETSMTDSIAKVDNSKKLTVNTAGEVVQTLSPDVFYDFTGSITSLTLTLAPEIANRENEYKGHFLSGGTPPTVTFPTSVTWIGGLPVIEANKTYQFSILKGIGVLVGV